MAQSLQSKVQLLTLLVVVFTLLSIPLFFQVRADLQNDKHDFKNTWLNKFFRDSFKKPPEGVEVEDVWGDYLKKQGENCGAVCDPNGDYDQDGYTNKQEIEMNRNPACNEEANPPGYCAGEPPIPPTNGTTVQPLNETLYDHQDAASVWSEDFPVALRKPNYDKWVVSWHLTDFKSVGGSYEVKVLDAAGNLIKAKRAQVDLPFNTPTDDGFELPSPAPRSGATYRIEIVSDSDVIDGKWDLHVQGVRFGSQSS